MQCASKKSRDSGLARSRRHWQWLLCKPTFDSRRILEVGARSSFTQEIDPGCELIRYPRALIHKSEHRPRNNSMQSLLLWKHFIRIVARMWLLIAILC